MIRSKRIDILIKAISRLNEIGYDIHLNILGSGPELSNLEALKNSLSLQNINFLGEITHNKVPDQLRLSDIYVTCSETEGFGNSTIEGYFCGLRVIATDIDIHKELGGREFLYFKKNSVCSLVNALENCISNNFNEPFENRLVHLSLSHTNKELIKFYNEQNNSKI